MAVVNDAAERGVKLVADFKDTTRKEGNLQAILQTVENERARLPDRRNRGKEP